MTGTDYHRTITAVSQTSNDADAVFSVGQTYERPGGTTSTFLPGFDGRLKYARRALAGAGAAGQAGTPVPLGAPAPAAVVAAIKMLQTALVPYGYNIAVDGIWGTGTEAALQTYLDQTGS
jgi:hypothetical protein